MERKAKKAVKVGNLLVGGVNPIYVQSMTSTLTWDVKKTITQIRKLEKAGCEIVRIAVPDTRSLAALDLIIPKVKIPLIADIHFSPALAIGAIKKGVDGIRINPGNIGSKAKLVEILKLAGEKGCCIRIGVNSGSLDKKHLTKRGQITAKGLVDSTLEFLDFFESKGFFNTKVSIKSSDVVQTIEANRLFHEASDYPIHLGVTESGTLLGGSIRSSIALGILLSEGIGDTIRVSLSSDPAKEIKVAFEILKALGLRRHGVTIISCPTCSRKSFDVEKIANKVERELSNIKDPISIAVMGCIVNGPGEASHADLGVAGGKGKSVLFEKGKIIKKLDKGQIEKELIARARKLALSLQTRNVLEAKRRGK